MGETSLTPEAVSSPEEFGELLSQWRRRAGLTVRALARAADVPASTVGGYLTGRHLPPTHRPESLRPLLAALGVPENSMAAWLEAVQRIADARLPLALHGQRPYLGLSSFGTDAAGVFFGRDGDVAALVVMLDSSRISAGSQPTDRLMIVLGTSGSGKSSLVQAGLIPALGPEWSTTVLRPGAEPVEALEAALGTLDAGRSDRLLIVDQGEELWTRADATGRSAFLEWLSVALADNPRLQALFVLRADFYTSATREPLLLAGLQNRQFLLGALDPEQLAEVITGPAGLFGLAVAPGLVDRLVTDTAVLNHGRHTAALPLLSHCLASMVAGSDDRRLTHAGYERVGRLGGAVAATAEAAYQELSEPAQDAARNLLLRLVVIEPGLPPSASELSRTELDPEQAEVVELLTERRLLSLDGETIRLGHEALITAWPRLAGWIEDDVEDLRTARLVARDAQSWTEQDRDPGALLRGGRLATAVSVAALRPALFGPAARDYLSASELAEKDSAAQRRRTLRRTRRLLAAVSALAVLALIAGIGLAVSQVRLAAQERAARADQLAAQSTLYAASDPLLSSQLALAAYATDQTTAARSAVASAASAPLVTNLAGPVGSRVVATHGTLLASAGQDSELVLYDGATVGPRRLARVPVPTVTGSAVYAAAFSPDGRWLAVGGTAREVRIWDLSDPRHPRRIAADLKLPETVTALQFDNHAGLYIATASPAVQRFSLSTGVPAALGAITVPPQPAAVATDKPVEQVVSALRVLADGSLLVGTATGLIGHWTPASGTGPASTLAFHTRKINGFVETSAGVHVATDGSRAAIIAVDGGGLRVVRDSIGDFKAIVGAIAASPDHRTVAYGSADKTLHVLTVDGTALETVPVPDVVTSLAYLSDGRLAIGVRSGQTVLRQPPIYPGVGPVSAIWGLGWARERPVVMAPVYTDGAEDITLVDVSEPWRPQQVARVYEPFDGENRAGGNGDISPSGRLMVSVTFNGALAFWNLNDLAAPRFLQLVRVLPAAGAASEDTIESARFLSDSELMISSDDGYVRLLTVDDTGRITERWRGAGSGKLLMAATSGDRSVLAASGTKGKVFVFQPSKSRKPVTTIDWSGYLYGLAISRDGRHLAVGGIAAGVRIYDISDPVRPRLQTTLASSGGTTYALDYNQYGDLLGVTDDGTVQIWRNSDGGLQRQLSFVAPQQLQTGRWSPDGTTAAIGGQGAYLGVVPADAATAESILCAAVGDPLSPEQWRAILPDVDVPAICT